MLPELCFQSDAPHGPGPAVESGSSLGKLDVREEHWRWLASDAKPGHKTSAFSVQNERWLKIKRTRRNIFEYEGTANSFARY